VPFLRSRLGLACTRQPVPINQSSCFESVDVYVTYLSIANDCVNLAEAAAAGPLDDLVGSPVGLDEPGTTLGHGWFMGSGEEKTGIVHQRVQEKT
jgi:hypothetical protein